MKKILLVQPLFPVTYWGFQDAIKLVNKSASLPPLGLVTLAGCLPESWELRLVDLNVTELRDEELLWADSVFISGMTIQLESMLEVTARAHRLQRQVVVGGPTATLCPELFPDAEVIFQGEAEERIDELAQAMTRVGLGDQLVLPSRSHKPEMSRAPLPRFDLLDLSQYTAMSIQYSRGCPFHCEFCDIIEIYGRASRVKTNEQIMAELDELYLLNFQGSIFIVDDNFIGKKRAVRQLLPQITEWQLAHDRVFDFYTEVSINLAADQALMESMIDAGFRALFVGIETPSLDALREAGKGQNLRIDLNEAVDTMTRNGFEVMGGFIVGFDKDGPEIFEAQRQFIQHSPIPLAMVGILGALPGTALWRRLEDEGRLRGLPAGDQFSRANFESSMDEEVLLRGYHDLMRDLYSPEAFYERCERYIDQVGEIPISGDLGFEDTIYFLKAILRIGLRSPRRLLFWRLLRRAKKAPPHAYKWAVVKALQGEHMIRYTEEHVLPRIEQAIAEVVDERRGAQRHLDSTRTKEPPNAHHPKAIGATLQPQTIPVA